MVHETLIDKVRTTLNTSGFLYFAWVVPYSIALIIFLLVYVKFIFNLPSKTRILFLISGSVYISGALGIELIGGRYSELYGYNVIYFVITTIEELLEMTGVVVFIYALTSYIDSEFKDLRLRVSSSSAN